MADSVSHKSTIVESRHTADPAPTVTLDTNATPMLVTRVEINEAALPVSFGRFELRAVVGQGGFGTVYRAYDTQLDRDVAVKIPRRGALETADQINRFLREARSGGKLNHPNICPIHDAGEFGGNHFIVMGYIDGAPLTQYSSPERPMDPRTAAKVIVKLTGALAQAHEQGIIHRDLKPSNVMIDEKRKEPVILDFGLARSYLRDAFETQEGQVLGTPSYMSPEQATGSASDVGPKSDIYSLGVILYQLIVGCPPFRGSTAQVFAQILTADPEPPSKHVPGLDPQLDAICLKAMAKDPKQRFEDMRDFGKALKGFLQGASAAGPLADAAPSASGAAPAPESSIRAVVPDKIEFACLHCGLPVRTPLSTAGKKGKCPSCGAIFQIPARPTPVLVANARGSGLVARGSDSSTRIQFACPHCSNTVWTPLATAGKKGKCPSCAAIIDIPTVRPGRN